jgi:ribosomal protein S18 acetylase RimI-like enzyme
MAMDNVRSITLRSEHADDQDFLFALYASTRAEELGLAGWNEDQKHAFLAMQFNAQHQSYLMSYPHADRQIVMWEDKRVGRLLIDRSGSDILLVDVALLPEYRRGGVGTFLIQSLLREANNEERNVRLHVLRANVAARLYQRLGFTLIADDGVYLEMVRVPDSTQVSSA